MMHGILPMPEKVAFFLPHFGHGGAEGVVLRLLDGMDRTRHTPVLVLQRRQGELLARVPGDVPVLALRHPRPPRCIPELARLYADEGVALAVTMTNAASLYSIPAARLAGTAPATLVTEHTPPSSFLPEAKLARLRRMAIRLTFPHATLIGGPIGEIGADLADMLGAAAPEFVLLPNPVVDHVGPMRPVPDLARHVVSVGRLAPEKRFDLLIDAFAALHRDLPDARLTLHGEGSERAALEAQILRLGLGDAVRLAGYASDMDKVHRTADLFVCTSRREGLGNAIIEAMARGIPVVSVDCPFGPRRLLRDGRAGRLVQDASASAIAEAMKTTLGSQDLRRRYVDAAFDVARDYEAKAAVAIYQATFDRAIAERRRAR